jgi:hypothetical protein
MLAARDQENLVHGHQAAAASKPLNQGARQLPPKTPGKVPKTPFKVPLNDENVGGFGGGKTGGKVFARGNENIMTATKKGGLNDRFVTPMGMEPSLSSWGGLMAYNAHLQVQRAELHWELRLRTQKPKPYRHQHRPQRTMIWERRTRKAYQLEKPSQEFRTQR